MIRPRTILVAVDFSESSNRALEAALGLAERFSAKVHLIHALEVPLPIFEPYAVSVPAAFLAEARKAAQQKLDAALEKVREKGVAGTATLGEVPAASAVASRADEIGADLVVVGTRGHTGLKHILLGSVAERTVHDAHCSVLTVKADGEPSFPPKAIAVGVDFSDPAAAALAAARELATEFGAKLHLVHALDLRIPFVTPYEVSVPDAFIESARESAKEKLDALCQEARKGGVAAEGHLVSAAPASALSEAAKQIGVDLLVTGSRGLTGLKHVVLGSVAERTLRYAPCSVLTVKPSAEA
jgi:nucleotide-binding universal stress UspA family protein